MLYPFFRVLLKEDLEKKKMKKSPIVPRQNGFIEKKMGKNVARVIFFPFFHVFLAIGIHFDVPWPERA